MVGEKFLAKQVSPEHLDKLYRLGLLRALETLPGMGDRRMEALELQMEDDPDQEGKVPGAWGYRLYLDLASEPITAQNLLEIREDGCSLLDQFRLIDADLVAEMNQVITKVLTRQQRTVLLNIYRDGMEPLQVAKKFATNLPRIQVILIQARQRLRQRGTLNQIAKILTGAELPEDWIKPID